MLEKLNKQIADSEDSFQGKDELDGLIFVRFCFWCSLTQWTSKASLSQKSDEIESVKSELDALKKEGRTEEDGRLFD